MSKYTVTDTELGRIIVRNADGAFIPQDELNRDYQEYLAETEGNADGEAQ